jgi:PAS domain S-box-containing protein
MRNNTIQITTCAGMIARIHEAVSKGNLNEAHELILLFDGLDAPSPSPVEEMKITLLKGVVMLKRGEYKAAEESLLRSLQLADAFGDTRLRYNRYDNLVTLYTVTNQIHYAIDYLKKSMELKESTSDDAAYARSLIQMSSLLFTIADYEDSRNVLQKAETIISRLDDGELKMQCHFANASLLCREKKYDEAFQKYDQVIILAKQANDILHITRAYYNQGDIMMEMGRLVEAEEIYTKLLTISTDYHLITQELLTSVQLAWIALRLGDTKRCRELYDYVYTHKELGEDDALMENLAEVGAKLYEAEGDLQNALDAYRTYMQSYKVHYDNEQSKVVLFIKARYENEKKERELQEIKLAKMESEIKVLIAEQALRKSEKRFKAWIENGTDMIVILNRSLQPSYTSPFVYKIFKYQKEEFININIYDLMHPEDLPHVMEMLKIAQQSPGAAINAQFRFPQKDGRYRWIESTITNLLQDETVNGIVCNLKDITERKQSEDAIQELNKSLEIKITERTSELQEAINDLEAFSYSVSHDLRSPLRIITGYAKLLMSDHEHYLNEEAKEFVNTILDSSKRMGQLIDDLLNFSRMGRKAVYKSDVDINNMVGNIIIDIRRTDETLTKNIIIHELPPAYCDMALIKQVWINLISNAIKYTSKKSTPQIEIGSIARFNETVYYITDNGAGFDMKFAKNLFTVFKRLHDRTDFDGMGVGLALAHRIIKMHEGRIWAEAEVEKGATFFFTL